MRKKSFVLLLILMFVSLSLSAGFLEVGANYTIDLPIDKTSETPLDLKAISFKKFKLGTDLRFNIGYITLEESLKGAFTEELLLSSFDISSSVGLKAKFFFMDVILACGLRTSASKSGSDWIYNSSLKEPSFMDAVKTSTIFYKTTFDINIGKKVILAFSLLAPTNQTLSSLYEEQTVRIADALAPDLKKSELAVGLLFSFF